MSFFIVCSSLLLMTVIQPVTMVSVTILGEGTDGVCPSQESRDAVIQNTTAIIRTMVQGLTTSQNCGAGLWYRVAYLDMSDPSQQCPAAWREYNTQSGVRACGRPVSSGASCPATFYTVSMPGHQYSKVCGRAVGYQIGSPNGFGFQAESHPLDSYYVYGVSITHGAPRNHIWTFAAGISEGDYVQQSENCPCSDPSAPNNAVVPSFVGDNYYCESGNPTDTFISNHLYSNDPLWDGQQCEGQCCSNGISPPRFSVELPNPTTDDIEVRICCAEGTVDDVAVQILELYVQ